jgi:hypothetical protein
MAQAQAPAKDPSIREQPTRPTNEAPETIYCRPAEKIHLTKAGQVALGNWIGKVDGSTWRVYFGAPIAKVPANVRAAMKQSRIGFGLITMDDLAAIPKDRTLPEPEPQPEE